MMTGSIFKFIDAYQKLQSALTKGEPADNPYVWLVCFGLGICVLFFGYRVAAIITRVRCWGCDAYVPREACSETDSNSWICPVCLKNSDSYPFGSRNLPLLVIVIILRAIVRFFNNSWFCRTSKKPQVEVYN